MQEKKEAEKQMTKKGKQQLLDFEIVKGPREFTRTGILHAVAKLIATDNQVCYFLRTVDVVIDSIPIAPCPCW